MDLETKNEFRRLSESMKPLSRRFGSIWGIFILGIVQGIGVVVGATLFVIVVSWFINLLGLVPGLEHLADTIRELLDYAAQRR